MKFLLLLINLSFAFGEIYLRLKLFNKLFVSLDPKLIHSVSKRAPLQRQPPQVMDGYMLKRKRMYPWSKRENLLSPSPTPEESLQNLENEINSWLYGYDPIKTESVSLTLIVHSLIILRNECLAECSKSPKLISP